MINLQIPINSLGFGLFSLGYLKILLENSDIKIALKDITPQTDSKKSYKQLIKDFELNETLFYDSLNRDFSDKAKTFIIWHPGSIYKYIYGKETIGFTHFETTKMKQSEIKQIQNKNISKILVTNNWAKNCLEQYDIKSGIIPGPANYLYLDNIKNQKPLKINNRNNEPFFFSSGKWEIRKGHLLLIEAFSKLTEQATLIGLWSNVFLKGNFFVVQYLQQFGYQPVGISTINNNLVYIYINIHNNTRIILYNRILSYLDIVSIYKTVDCYISVSAGEGWDLPLVEAMSLGVPVIATNNTAHSEYITEDNSFMLSTNKEKLAIDNIWFKGDVGNWYPTNTEDILQKLSTVCVYYKNNPQRLVNIGKKGQETINKLSNAQILCDKLLSYLL